MSRADPVSTLWQQGSPVQSIAFDDPWLAAALENGSSLLLNVESAMRGGRSGESMLYSPPQIRHALASMRSLSPG